MTAARAVLALASVSLLALSGCASLGLEHPPTAPRSMPTVGKSSSAPRAKAPSASGALTDAQVQAALITAADLGAAWAATQGAATWRDGLLKATTPAGECQRLLDALYADELLGAPARAVVGLDDAETGAQLRYQVSGQRPADADRTLAWLRTLPQQCARFTATTATGAVQDVQVSEAPLPEVGDVRQGLRVTLASETEDGEETLLTLDMAAVRVGRDAFALTNGGLGDVPNGATQAAVQLGALRLADVRKQGRAQI